MQLLAGIGCTVYLVLCTNQQEAHFFLIWPLLCWQERNTIIIIIINNTQLNYATTQGLFRIVTSCLGMGHFSDF